MKRQFHTNSYWLLKEESAEPLLSDVKNGINSEENRINSEENGINSTEESIKEKENKNKYIYMFANQDVNIAFQRYLLSQQSNGVVINQIQKELLIKELNAVTNNDAEKLALLNKATMKGWTNFEPIQTKKTKTKVNKVNNCQSRSYDMDLLEHQLLNNN